MPRRLREAVDRPRVGWGGMPPRRRRHSDGQRLGTSFPDQGSEQRVRQGERAMAKTELACSPQPHHVHWLFSWQTREGAAGRQVGSGGVGTPTAPSSGTVYTHAHAHTRPTRACTTSPTWPLGQGLVSASPIQLGRNPSSGGCGDLWLSQESPKA